MLPTTQRHTSKISPKIYPSKIYPIFGVMDVIILDALVETLVNVHKITFEESKCCNFSILYFI